MPIKRKVQNEYVLPVTVYGCETWALKKAHMELHGLYICIYVYSVYVRFQIFSYISIISIIYISTIHYDVSGCGVQGSEFNPHAGNNILFTFIVCY